MAWKLEEEGEIPGVERSLREKGRQDATTLRLIWLCGNMA